ncbi:MAG TPA: hypothetical protein VMW52_11465 [Phycisphaerae bacterium]|nr:hypothetical protein [Phycisphaerae bacterium]
MKLRLPDALTAVLLVALVALAALTVGGCASMVALSDTQTALTTAETLNVENWTRVRAAQLKFIDDQLAGLDTTLAEQLAIAANGERAAGVLTQYRAAQDALTERRSQIALQYGTALDNAFFAQELQARERRIVMGWWNLLDQIPGLDAMRAAAEARARQWIADHSPPPRTFPIAGSP